MASSVCPKFLAALSLISLFWRGFGTHVGELSPPHVSVGFRSICTHVGELSPPHVWNFEEEVNICDLISAGELFALSLIACFWEQQLARCLLLSRASHVLLRFLVFGSDWVSHMPKGT